MFQPDEYDSKYSLNLSIFYMKLVSEILEYKLKENESIGYKIQRLKNVKKDDDGRAYYHLVTPIAHFNHLHDKLPEQIYFTGFMTTNNM